MFGWKRRNDGLIVQVLRLVLDNQKVTNRKLDSLMTSSENIQSEVNDLNAAVSTISAGVGTLNTNLATASQRIAELEAQGVDPEVIGNLKAAVDGAQSIADAFGAAVDPEQPTPAPEELPEAVTPETTDGESTEG